MIVELESGRLIKPYDKKDLSGKFEITKVTKKRSNPQNAYLHGILFPELAKGMTAKAGKTISPELAKAVVKKKFLEVFTEVGTIELPTSKLNTKQCMEFIEKCQQYAAEMLETNIPSPNEVDFNLIQETE